MEKHILYSTGCPKCKILEKKLIAKGVEFDICDNTEEMRSKGITSVPVLHIPSGEDKGYLDAVRYANSL